MKVIWHEAAPDYPHGGSLANLPQQHHEPLIVDIVVEHTRSVVAPVHYVIADSTR
jgi:hypothetical protein